MPPAPTQSPTQTSPPPAEAPSAQPFLGLSLPQVMGSALAAATSALAASFLGVAGTIIGALVGSLIATIGSAVYSHSLRRAGTRLRTVRPLVVDGTASSRAHVVEGPPPPRPERRRWPVWARLATGIVVVAALALAAITLLEGALGHPVSDSGTKGTTIGRAVEGAATTPKRQHQQQAPQPAPTTSVPRAEQSPTNPVPSPTTEAPTGAPSPTTTGPVPGETSPTEPSGGDSSAPTQPAPQASTATP